MDKVSMMIQPVVLAELGQNRALDVAAHAYDRLGVLRAVVWNELGGSLFLWLLPVIQYVPFFSRSF